MEDSLDAGMRVAALADDLDRCVAHRGEEAFRDILWTAEEDGGAVAAHHGHQRSITSVGIEISEHIFVEIGVSLGDVLFLVLRATLRQAHE